MSDSEKDAYFRGLNPETVVLARELSERFDFSRHDHLLDVGGGAGALAIVLSEANANLQATVAELPEITPITQRYVDEVGATDRVQVMGCDVVNGPIEGMYDVAVMSRLIQVLSPDQARRAVYNVSQVVSPGGTVHILGHMLDDSRVSPPAMVTFDLLFLNTYDQGQAYTEGEYAAWMNAAGLEGFERVSLPNGMSIVTAHKPA